MALLELDAEATEALIADYPGVRVAGYASPRQTVVAGPPDAGRRGDRRGAAGRTGSPAGSNMEVASHHRDDGSDPARTAGGAGRSDARDARHPVLHRPSQTGHDAAHFDADYWVANVRKPVRFSQAIAAAGARHATFIEISAASDADPGDHRHPRQSVTHHHSSARCSATATTRSSFHTNLNATHTVRPPHTPHPPEPHPVLPDHAVAPHPALDRHHRCCPTHRLLVDSTRFRHRRPTDGADPGRLVLRADLAGSASCHRRASRRRASWLVLGDADLGAEIGRGSDVAADGAPPSLTEDADDAGRWRTSPG